MIGFIKTYSQILFILPILYITGNIFAPLGILVLFLIMTGWISNQKYDHAIILTFIILIMGDSRSADFLFVKNLRIVAIIVLGLQTIFDLMKGRYPFKKVFLLSIPFWIIAILGGLRSPEVGTSISKMISYFLLLLIGLHFFDYHIKKNNGKLIVDVASLTGWVLVIGFLLIIVNTGYVIFAGRYRGVLGNPNGLGIYCTLMFMLIIAGMDIFPRQKRLFQFVIGFILLSVILSESRTSLGTIGIFYFLYLFYKRGRFGKVSLWLFILPFIFFFFNVVKVETIVSLIGLDDYLRVDSLRTGTGRFLAWEMGWRHIQENLWIGRGFAYEELFFKSISDILINTEHQGGMHNSYLTFIMNNGIIGFLAIAFFFAMLFRQIKAPAFGMPFIITVLISGNFESWLNSSLNSFTIHFVFIMVIFINYQSLKSTNSL